MKLFMVECIGNWKPRYDTMDCIIVRAVSEQEARNIAADNCGDEGKSVWLDKTLTSCTEITGEGQSGVVLRSF